MLSCLNCGRRGVATDRYCTACGGSDLGHANSHPGSRGRASTPTVQLRSIRTIPCPHCARAIDRETPFCLHCGLRVIGELGDHVAMRACEACGASPSRSDARFCGACGVDFPIEGARTEVRTAPRGTQAIAEGVHLALIDDAGDVTDVLRRPTSPAAATSRDGVRVAPLPSCSSMFVFVHERHQVEDGDVFLIGGQRIRFRLLERAKPARPSRIGGETASRDVAVLEQLRADDSVRDTLHLTRGRRVLIGRDAGDWVFPYDGTVSARHCELVPSSHANDIRGSWILRDLGSRNGTGVAVRTARRLRAGERLLVGGQMMRVERM